MQHRESADQWSDIDKIFTLSVYTYILGGFTIFQKFEFDKVQLIHGAYQIPKHGSKVKIILDQGPHRAEDLKFSGSCFTAAYLEQ